MRGRLFLSALAIPALAACSDPGASAGQSRTGAAPPAATSAPSAPPAPPLPPPPDGVEAAAAAPAADPAPGPASDPAPDPQAAAVNGAALNAGPAHGWSPTLVRAQVLLARAHFSPGEIDGRDGDNFRNALSAFRATHGLSPDGQLDEAVWRALTAADPGPVLTRYAISAADVAGPFAAPPPPDDLPALARLPRLDYGSPLEALAERFHMDEGLLKALNPGVDFSAAGARILVAAWPDTGPPPQAARVEVDKTARQVRAYDIADDLLATYPATVGSSERPAPSGAFKITGVAQNPTYTYDPQRLTYGDRSLGKITVKPGPNNPVGLVWIGLNIPTYGLHGAPEPKLVGKAASHGCVRLTNWDAEDLAGRVKPGVKVVFVGSDAAAVAHRTPAHRR